MKQRLVLTAVSGAASLCLFFALHLLGLFASIEYWLLDSLFTLRGPLSPPEEVVIVALDEVSYEAYEQRKVSLNQPWPRGLHAELLKKLNSYGAKRVVFDVLFLGEGPDPSQDSAFAEALKGLPVFLGAESVVESIHSDGGAYVLEKLNQPHVPFLKAASGMALVGLPDENGTVRRFLSERAESAQHVPSLAEAAAGISTGELKQKPSGRDLINYYGPPRTIKTLSYSQVVQEELPLPEHIFKDKAVFVGLVLRTAVGPAQKDTHKSPFARSNIFGTEIHATAAANLIRGDWIRRLSPAVEFALLGLVVVGGSCAVWLFPPVVGGSLTLLTFLVWFGTSYFSFTQGFFLPGLTAVGLCIPSMLCASSLYHYMGARKSEQRVKSALELYLSPEMLKEMQKNPEALSLGGEKRWATALFSDIAGFTEISETLPAEAVASMLNDYFSEIMEVVFENKGTLIKFIGDSAFVLFGAPLAFNDHAAKGVQAALEMQRRISEFNGTGKYPKLHTRIGLNTGPMVIGNLGSKRRFDYTAIGDAVNLASRVEGLNKYLGTSLLITESVRKELGESVPAIRLGKVRVVGKRESVTLYTIPQTAHSAEFFAAWESMLNSFEDKKWREVEERAAELRKTAGESSLLHFLSFLEGQVQTFISIPPPASWRGELEFSKK